ncbi:hypothetical protein L6452_04602 [Arctium lappa]|uniref:Uncharacterized protein n=1 Tax=Arctium lappa TaxID=4217 RepID=A0ACB9EDR0_ARCLA|nr:hypothetical protein L6452_04602 [Arctium lappa]
MPLELKCSRIRRSTHYYESTKDISKLQALDPPPVTSTPCNLVKDHYTHMGVVAQLSRPVGTTGVKFLDHWIKTHSCRPLIPPPHHHLNLKYKTPLNPFISTAGDRRRSE